MSDLSPPFANAPAAPFAAALLPWEDQDAYAGLRRALMDEHQPHGPTEDALVERLAWTEWRRRRLVLGERAAHMTAIAERTREDYKAKQSVERALIGMDAKPDKAHLAPALRARPEADHTDTTANNEDEGLTLRALAVLETGDPQGYGEALGILRADTVGWWTDMLEDDAANYPEDEPPEEGVTPYRADAASLIRFIRENVLPLLAQTRSELETRPAIRLQAWGESVDPFRMDKILALDERLNRQFEKVLGMLLRLKEMRAAAEGAAE